jgi:acyl-CoA synthetase (AMP-forming)/AMP-acid ligase II
MSPPRLGPGYAHPLAARWSRPGGPWGPDTLDDLLAGPADVERRVAEVAGGLAARGVGRGDAVAWQKPNGPLPIWLFRACWRLGAVACPIHHLAGPADVRALLDRLDPTVFLDPDAPAPVAPPVARGDIEPVPPQAVAVALATSGSTGTPKLALHSHRGLVYKARTMARVHGLGPGDAILMPAPFAHISGLLNGVLLAACGMRVVPMARWDPALALDLIARERITFMIGPPAFFVSMIDSAGFSPPLVRTLRQVSCGGAGVTAAFVATASEALGCRVKRTYGSTEAPTVTTSTLADPAELAATTDGRAVGEVELRVVDADGSGAGELWVRGPELFVGYDDPIATRSAFAEGGWFRTGDVGRLDAGGWLTIVGRLTDVIIRGGENISAAEVEGVLEAHPDVRQAVAVGYPDARLTERVCAFVVGATGRPFGLGECRRWFAARGVAKFKWPERVVQVPSLPLLPSGKPDRATLRRQASS